MRKTIVFGLALFLLPIITLAQEATSAKILDYGIYTQKTESTVNEASTPSTKRDVINDVTFIEKTTRIPAKKDVCFGFRFIIEGKPSESDIVIVKKMIHPPISEAGRTYTSHEYELTYTLGTEHTTGFTFGSDYLMVPGEWTMQIFSQGKKLLEQTFTVYKP